MGCIFNQVDEKSKIDADKQIVPAVIEDPDTYFKWLEENFDYPKNYFIMTVTSIIMALLALGWIEFTKWISGPDYLNF